MMNNIIIWTEGGQKIGMGHVNRCLAIARQLNKEGRNVSFLINDDASSINLLQSGSFSYKIASISIANCSKFFEENSGIVIIDTKKSIAEIVKRLKGYGFKTVLIDNSTDARLECDILVCPTVIFKSRMSRDGFKGKVFGGGDYVPISKIFLKTRQEALKVTLNPPYQVLVTMGGSDPKRLTFKVVSSLLQLSIPVKITVVIGPAFSPCTDLVEIEEQNISNIDFIRDVKDLSKIMAQSYVCITAFGTTLLELAYMGVPSIIIANFKSDSDDMSAFKKLKIGIPLGYYKDVSSKDFERAAMMLVEDKRLRESMSQDGKKLIDGKGAERIASIIKGLQCG